MALEDAAALMPVISQVLSGWPYTTATQCDGRPFVTLKPDTKGFWQLTLDAADGPPRRWDAVNVICDLVAEMAWERLRSDPALLSIHAAGVAFAGRLVVFPNARRAGKSTLTASLAHLGHQIYTDDFLPLRNDAQSGQIVGIANGVAPRIRLPLPEDFSQNLQHWVAADTGPANRQYKYLCGADIAKGGATMPLGAMIILERQSTPVAPSLEQISRADALASLITQNFARAQVSGAILTLLQSVTDQLPVYRLVYHCGDAAAAFLTAHPALQDLPTAKGRGTAAGTLAPLDRLGQTPPSFATDQQYIRADGLTETKVGDEHFLADRDGLSIFRLNAGSVAIWNLLDQPTDLAEVIEILAAAFPDVAQTRIATDSETLMRQLAEARLIVPAAADMAAE